MAKLESLVAEHYERMVQAKLDGPPGWKHNARTGGAIIQQYKNVKKECLTFESTLQAAKALKPTGDPSEENFIRYGIAKTNMHVSGSSEFYKFDKRVDDANPSIDVGRNPWFLTAWRLMRTTSLWHAILSGMQSNSAASKVAAAQGVTPSMLVAQSPVHGRVGTSTVVECGSAAPESDTSMTGGNTDTGAVVYTVATAGRKRPEGGK
jgi:hypothetical protein